MADADGGRRDHRWRIVGASVIGSSHVETGTPCQDAHAAATLPGDRVVLAVADGAGSAPRSQDGARAAVDYAAAAMVRVLASSPPDDADARRAAIMVAFREARDAIARLATAAELPLNAFAATLTCAVADRAGLTVGQLGDGLTVVVDGAGELHSLIPPVRGEYANETEFLTRPNALERVAIKVVPEATTAVALSTDGLLRLALQLPANEPYPAFFDPVLSFAAEADDERAAAARLVAFLASPRVSERTDDDKTLLIAIRDLPTAVAQRLAAMPSPATNGEEAPRADRREPAAAVAGPPDPFVIAPMVAANDGVAGGERVAVAAPVVAPAPSPPVSGRHDRRGERLIALGVGGVILAGIVGGLVYREWSDGFGLLGTPLASPAASPVVSPQASPVGSPPSASAAILAASGARAARGAGGR